MLSFHRNCKRIHNWRAGMAQWWECSPSTNVSRVRFPDLASYVGWVCCWFSSLLRGFFSGFSSFPPSSKINISKFQFDREFEGHGFISWRLLCVTLVKQSRFILAELQRAKRASEAPWVRKIGNPSSPTTFPGSSLYLEKVPWLRLVTYLLDF